MVAANDPIQLTIKGEGHQWKLPRFTLYNLKDRDFMAFTVAGKRPAKAADGGLVL
jgi:hypothetical protein